MKPIKIAKDGSKWIVTWAQHGKPCAYVAKTKSEARGVAFDVGRHKLGLGEAETYAKQFTSNRYWTRCVRSLP